MGQRTPIRLEELPDWIAVDETVRSPVEGWHGVSVRGYQSQMADAPVPPIRDHLLVAYPCQRFRMTRELDGRRSSAEVGPGSVSLMTHATGSRWLWDGTPIDVLHVYLRPEQLVRACEQMYDRDIADVELVDTLDAQDPALYRAMRVLHQEAATGGPGSRLLVDSVAGELAVRMLRGHTHVRFRETGGTGGLSFQQERTVRAFVRENLRSSLSLDELAASVRLSRFHFSRMFRRATGLTPHEYVLQQRLELAQDLIRNSGLPLQAVAAESGFADQSHMTRVFRERLGATPAAYRAATRS